MVDFIINQCTMKNFNAPKSSKQIDLKHLINKSYLGGKEGERIFKLQSRIDEFFLDEVD